MSARTNAGTVADEFAAFAKSIPGQVKAALSPATWKERAIAAAEAALNAIAEDRERVIVPLYVKTIAVVALPNGMSWSMELPAPTGLNLLEEMRNAAAGPLFARNVPWEQITTFLEDWVANEKRKDERDRLRTRGMTDAEIADNIQHVLFTPAVSPEDENRKRKLRLALQEYAAKQAEVAYGMSVSRSNLWMETVLATWLDLLDNEVAGAVAERLRI